MKIELTEDDYDELSECLKLDPPTPDAPMYYVGGIDETVQIIASRHVGQALRDAADAIAKPSSPDRIESLVQQLRKAEAHWQKRQDDASRYLHERDAAEARAVAAEARVAELEAEVERLMDLADERGDSLIESDIALDALRAGVRALADQFDADQYGEFDITTRLRALLGEQPNI